MIYKGACQPNEIRPILRDFSEVKTLIFFTLRIVTKMNAFITTLLSRSTRLWLEFYVSALSVLVDLE